MATDQCLIPDPAKNGGAPTPPTAQHAIRQGRRVARNVAATLGNGKVRPFTYKTKGVFVDMGQGEVCGRDLSELGQLGHPARLEQPTAGGTPAGHRPSVAD